ncbi:MAG: hypothetical protein II304_06785 [Bacteroidales bacterium]|nr:hypothetical protein [Bacteroidales bacterium]
MSRSYRKVGAYAYCSGTDKKDRTLYHREERAKVRDLLKAQEKLGTDVGDLLYEEPCEKIVMNRVDRSLQFADKWCWSSDGGAWWREDISSIRKDFDKALFGLPPRNMFSWKSDATLWDNYIENRNAKYNKEHPQLMVSVHYLVESDDPWFKLRARVIGESCYVEKVKKTFVPYNKAHKIPPHAYKVDGKITNVYIYKVRGKGPLSGKQYSVTDYAIMTAPNTFQRPEELINWLRANQEKIILRYFRRCFSK